MLTFNLNLSEREEAISSAWYRALADTGDIPHPAEHIRNGLLRITRQILLLISDEVFKTERARAIGARFVLLGFKRMDVLAVVQPILYQTLIQELEPSQVEPTLTRLGRILIEMTTGFLEQHHRNTQFEQEQTLQSYENEWKRFITDRQEMEQKSQAILRALPDTLGIITLDGTVLYYHAGSDRSFPNEEELPFKNIRSYLPDQVADELLAIFRSVIESGHPRTHEYSVTFQDGEKHDFQDHITPYLVNSVLVISRDVTRQIRIEGELRDSEARYRNVIEDQAELIARWKPDATLTFVNRAAQDFTGLKYDQLIGFSYSNFIQPVDPVEAEKLYTTVYALTPENPVADGHLLINAHNSQPRWIQWRTRAIFNENQQITEFQTVASDITEIKRIQDELRDSEARYRSVVETQNEIIGRFKPDGTITFINKAAERLFGIPTAAMLGHNILEYAPGLSHEFADGIPPYTELLTPQAPSITRELMVVRADGVSLQLEVATQAIFNAQGEVTEFQTTGRDVTDLRQMEAALRESEARYRSMVEGQTELIIRYLPDGTITFANDALCEFFSKTQQELLGGSAIDFVYQADKTSMAENLANLKNIHPEHPFQSGMVRVITAKDEVRWVEWTTRVIFGPDGAVTECQSVGRDITVLREAQETLEQQNELLRQLGEQLIKVQEIERQRISRDLHDSVLNELGAMLIAPPEMLTPKTVRDNYERLIEQLRQTINGLRTPMLNYGLHAALEDLIDILMDNPQAEGILTMEIPPSQARFDENVELHLFRIIQQACDNALQHAQAKSIRIYGQIDENLVDITVEDDGIGFLLGQETDMAHILAKKHFGLVSMLERGKLIDARVNLFSNPGDGTKVQVLWGPVFSWT